MSRQRISLELISSSIVSYGMGQTFKAPVQDRMKSNGYLGWEVSLILEALRECYPLAALDNLVTICTSR